MEYKCKHKIVHAIHSVDALLVTAREEEEQDAAPEEELAEDLWGGSAVHILTIRMRTTHTHISQARERRAPGLCLHHEMHCRQVLGVRITPLSTVRSRPTMRTRWMCPRTGSFTMVHSSRRACRPVRRPSAR